MKKILMAVLVMVAVVGVFLTKGALAGQEQADFLISPSVWVRDVTAIETITIHAAYNAASIDENGIELKLDEVVVEDYITGVDSLGDIVIKFSPTDYIDLTELEKVSVTLAISGTDMDWDGGSYYDEYTVTVQDAGPKSAK